MSKNWLKDAQKAQGMVEFALVLPILLLIIMGIIGFGHLFFSYSAVVSASREAARYGAAVGVSANNIPHFRDCNEIRTMAVNAGRFAGVQNTAQSVNISYDKGPGTTPSDPVTSCPVNGTGLDAALGDRIIIQVNVQYRSIVPLVNIPSFPLTATTTRTIVRSLQIGEAPTAEAVCPETYTVITIMGEDSESHTAHSVVGQPVPMEIDVVPQNVLLPSPTTADSLYLFDSTLDPPVFAQQVFDAPHGEFTHTYVHAGTYLISGQYAGDIFDCYDDSALANQEHVVDAADTLLTINVPGQDEEFNKYYDTPLTLPVTVTLGAVAPGARSTWAGVVVNIRDVNDETNTCEAVLNAAGTGACDLYFDQHVGRNAPFALSASYVGDPDYKLAVSYVNIVIDEIQPTLVPTSTSVVPTASPDAKCPIITEKYFNNPAGSARVNISNVEDFAISIDSLVLTWPVDPAVYLREIRFDWNFKDFSCTDPSSPSNCLWYATSDPGDAPPSFQPSLPSPDSAMPANWTNELRMVFSSDLPNPSGAVYLAKLHFSNGCSVDIDFNH